jgi:hypothetical protein
MHELHISRQTGLQARGGPLRRQGAAALLPNKLLAPSSFNNPISATTTPDFYAEVEDQTLLFEASCLLSLANDPRRHNTNTMALPKIPLMPPLFALQPRTASQLATVHQQQHCFQNEDQTLSRTNAVMNHLIMLELRRNRSLLSTMTTGETSSHWGLSSSLGALSTSSSLWPDLESLDLDVRFLTQAQHASSLPFTQSVQRMTSVGLLWPHQPQVPASYLRTRRIMILEEGANPLLSDIKLPLFINQEREMFPKLLHRALMQLDLVEGGAKIATFMPDGESFQIRDQLLFEKLVLPAFFPRMKGFASFQRQLNLYDFKRIGGAGIDRGAYHHAFFIREDPELSNQMKRTKIKGTGHSRGGRV